MRTPFCIYTPPPLLRLNYNKTYIPPSLSGTSCETFWETDPLTDSCYQFNFQARLSWTEAWISCQQQGADLLSITKLHEQTYINGTDPVTSIHPFTIKHMKLSFKMAVWLEIMVII